MSKFILRGNKVLIDKPEKKEEDNKLDLILSKEELMDATLYIEKLLKEIQSL